MLRDKLPSAAANNKCNFSGQNNIVIYAMGCPAIFSSFYCLLALLMVVIFKLYKLLLYRLATYHVLSCFFNSFSMALVLMLLDYYPVGLYYKATCKITAFLLLYSRIMKLMFTSWLTFHLFSYVVFFKNLKRLEWLYISSSVSFPLLIACIPFINDSYGYVGAWCTIRSKNECTNEKYTAGIIEQFTLYYGPALCLLIVNIAAIGIMFAVMVYRAYKSNRYQPLLMDRDQKLKALKQLLPLLAYPIIYFVLILFPWTSRMYESINTYHSKIMIAHGVIHASMSTFAAMALMVHICVVRYGRPSRPEHGIEGEGHLSTCNSVTPYTSGAATKFSLPVESDIDDMKAMIVSSI